MNDLRKPERARPLRALTLVQTLASRSLAAVIVSGIALTISFVCGYLATRLIFGRPR